MITIGICDDEALYREQIRNMCIRYLEGKNIPFQCVEFASAEEVLTYQGESLTLLFLDVEMDGITGIELKDEIERTDRVWRIVFVTSHEEVIGQAFGLKTMGFARKPIEAVTAEKWISIAVEEQEANKVFWFTTEKGDLYIRENEILYLESEGNYSYVQTPKEKKFVCESLKKCEEIVANRDCIRVHKSYLVNMQEIKEVSIAQITIKNGATIPIGRTYRDEVKKKYHSYLRAVALRRV